MNTHYSEAGRLISIDTNSPDVVTARREARHESDDGCESCLMPDLGESIDIDGIAGIPRDALKRLLRFLLPTESTPRKRWRIAQLRLAILTRMTDTDNVGLLSFEELAQELGCSRALLSDYSLRIIDGLGMDKERRGKSRAARDKYRLAAIASHQARGHKMANSNGKFVK